jgi:hypothetical protein
MMPPPDEKLRKKLLEYIGGKVAKNGDQYDKGSSFFTHSSQVFTDEGFEPYLISKSRAQLNGLANMRIRSYEPILSK